MATNKSMIEQLERIDNHLRELAGLRKLLASHIAAQKRIGVRDYKDVYVKKGSKFVRVKL
jgi:hypothetical protein